MALTTLFDISKDPEQNILRVAAKVVACYKAMTTGENLNKWKSVYQQNIEVAAELLKKYQTLFKGGYLTNRQVFATYKKDKDIGLYKEFNKAKENLIDSTIGQHTFRVMRDDIESSLRKEFGSDVLNSMLELIDVDKTGNYPDFHLEIEVFQENLEAYFGDNEKSEALVQALGKEYVKQFLNHWYEFQKALHVACFTAINLETPATSYESVSIHPEIFVDYQQYNQPVTSITCSFAYLGPFSEYELAPKQIENLPENSEAEKKEFGEIVIKFYTNISNLSFAEEFKLIVKKQEDEERRLHEEYQDIIEYVCPEDENDDFPPEFHLKSSPDDLQSQKKCEQFNQKQNEIYEKYEKEEQLVSSEMHQYIEKEFGKDMLNLFLLIENSDLIDIDTEMGLEYTKKLLGKKIGMVQVEEVLKLMQNMEKEFQQKCKEGDDVEEITNKLAKVTLGPS